jgi:hypothetical protein
VSPSPPSLFYIFHLVQAHLLTSSVHVVLQQIKCDVVNQKHIVAPHTSSRPHLLLLEAIKPVVMTIEFLSTS